MVSDSFAEEFPACNLFISSGFAQCLCEVRKSGASRRLKDDFCVLVLSVAAGRMRETNGIIEADFRCVGGRSNDVRTGRVCPTTAGRGEAEAEDHSEAGNGGLVAGGAENPGGRGRELQCRRPE